MDVCEGEGSTGVTVLEEFTGVKWLLTVYMAGRPVSLVPEYQACTNISNLPLKPWHACTLRVIHALVSQQLLELPAPAYTGALSP